MSQQVNNTLKSQIMVGSKAKNKPEAYWIVYDPQQTSSSNIQTNSVQSSRKLEQQPCIARLTTILSGLSTSYATYRFINLITTPVTPQSIEEIILNMQSQFLKYKLTKRNLVFAILIPPVTPRQVSYIINSPYFVKLIRFYEKEIQRQKSQQTVSYSPDSSPRKMMKLSRKASFIVGEQIYVNLNRSVDEISEELIKVMKLDFIWLGVMSRLGTNVSKFQQILIQQEDFDPEYIGVFDHFFQQLNTLLFNKSRQHLPISTQTSNESVVQTIKINTNKNKNKKINLHQQQQITTQQLTQLLQQSLTITTSSIQSINTNIQQLIRSKFNSRVIFNDILLFGDYLPLLLSRNYFNLLYIETSTLSRYNQFKRQCQLNYSLLYEILTLENFLTIDDYWYRNFILKSLPNVKFIIDKANQNTPYEQIIDKHYKQIIPPYRPTFDQYFLSVCYVLKQRSACLKQAVGSIIVKDKRIVSTGYNGTPIDCINCFNGGCKVCNNSEKMNTEVLSCTCIHAEYGCILQAGIKVTPGSTLYSTKLPCLWCCKLIIQGKISKIVYLKSKYPHLQYENIALVKEILQKAKIQLLQVEQTKVFTSL